jgi:hypothetical protein
MSHGVKHEKNRGAGSPSIEKGSVESKQAEALDVTQF